MAESSWHRAREVSTWRGSKLTIARPTISAETQPFVTVPNLGCAETMRYALLLVALRNRGAAVLVTVGSCVCRGSEALPAAPHGHTEGETLIDLQYEA